MVAAILLLLQTYPDAKIDVNDLMNKMHAAYAKLHSADITVKVQLGSPQKYYVLTCRTRWVSPYLIRQDISEAKPNTPDNPTEHGFTYICDGKNLQTTGRDKDHDGVKPFSLSSIQDDGAPVYKETMTLWDWKRQWCGEKGGKGYEYHTARPTWNGKTWIGLAEINPPHNEYFQYYIDPKTYLIKRVVYYMAGESGWMPVGNYVVDQFTANAKIDRSLFKIKR